MGSEVNHHHSDNTYHSHQQVITPFNATQSLAQLSEAFDKSSIDVIDNQESSAGLEHEHANHSHNPTHPPFDRLFTSHFVQSEIIRDSEISYLNFRYAPPTPPPHTS